MTYLLIVYLYTGGSSIVVLPDSSPVECVLRSFATEFHWDWRVSHFDCVSWEGGEA